MNIVTICCQQCRKPFVYADSLWYCCYKQRNNNLYCCILCKQKTCTSCFRNRRNSTSYVIAQEQMRRNNQKKQSRSNGFRKAQNVSQTNKNYRYYQRQNFSQNYTSKHLSKQFRLYQKNEIPTNIKSYDFYNRVKSPQKKKLPENIYLDQKCKIQYPISEIHEILNKQNQHKPYIRLPCYCQVNIKELINWINDKCLICGKKQQSKRYQTILKNESYACSHCFSQLQDKIKYNVRVSLQEKKLYNYINSLLYKCFECQNSIRNIQSMSVQSFQSLNKPDEFILCKYCSISSKNRQKQVFQQIISKKEKQQEKFLKFNYHDQICNIYYPISQIHQLVSNISKATFVEMPCKCKQKVLTLKTWMKDKCLVCGQIQKTSSRKNILKHEGNICHLCCYNFKHNQLSKAEKQLQAYIDSLRYVCVQCNIEIWQQSNLSKPQQDDQQLVLCKRCYKTLKQNQKQIMQEKQKKERKQKTYKENYQKKKEYFDKQQKQRVKPFEKLNRIQIKLGQKTQFNICPVCQETHYLYYVQDLGMSICYMCKDKNSSKAMYQVQQQLNKPKFKPKDNNLKPQCSICHRLIRQNQWVCFRSQGNIICNLCSDENIKVNSQPQMKQKMKSVKQPQEEPFMRPKTIQRNDFPQQKQIQNESPKKNPQKSQNFQRNIKDKFSVIKQSKIQNIQKKIIIQNQNGYHQTHSRHIKEQQINQNGQKKIKQQKYNTQVKKSHRNQSSQRISNISQSKSNSDLKKSSSKQQQKQDQINKKNENFQRKDQSLINEDSLDVHQFLHKNQKILPDQISIIQMNKISGIKDSNEKRFIDLKNASLQQNQTIEKVLQKLNDQSFEGQVVPVNMKKQQSLKEQRISQQSQRNQSISFGALESHQPQQNNIDSHKFNYVQDSLQASNLKNQKKLKEDLNSDRNSLISESEPKLVSMSVKQNNFIKKEAQHQIQKKQAQKIVVRKPIFQKSKNQINPNPDPDHDPQLEKQFAIIQNQEIQIQFQQEDKFQTCMECGYLTKITELFIISNEQKIFVAKQENQRQQFQGIKMCKSCYVFQQSVLKMTQFQNSKKKSASNSKYRQMKSIQKNEPISLKRYTSSEKRKQKQRLDDLSSTQIPANKRYDYAYGQIGQGVSKEGLNLIRDKLKMGNQKTENQKDIYSQKYNLTGKVQKKDQIKVKQNYCQVCKRPTVVLFFDKYCSECFKKV